MHPRTLGCWVCGGRGLLFFYYYQASRNALFSLSPSSLENLDITLFIFWIPFSGTIPYDGRTLARVEHSPQSSSRF